MRRHLLLLLVLACALAAQADPTEEDETGAAALDPDYAGGVKAVEAKNWPAAIKLLSSAALRDTRNADLQNLIAYSYRNSGDLAAAFKYYNRALQLKPRHRGAHEYIGEAYLMVGNVAKAEEHLAELKRICLVPCDEQGHLEAKIAQYRGRAAK